MEYDIDWPNLPFRRYAEWRSLWHSMNDLEKCYRFGSIDNTQYRWRRLFWHWSTVRYSSKQQDRCFDSLGQKGIDRRIARVMLLRDNYINHYFKEYIIESTES